MNLCALGPSLRLSGLIPLINPSLKYLRAFLASFLDRLLQREPPERQVFSDRTHMQRNAAFVLDEPSHAARFHKARSIFNCSVRLLQMMRSIICSCGDVSA